MDVVRRVSGLDMTLALVAARLGTEAAEEVAWRIEQTMVALETREDGARGGAPPFRESREEEEH